MRSPSSPPKKTSPLVWVGLVGFVGVVYMTMDSGPDPTTLKTSTVKKKSSTAKAGSLYTEADQTAKFPPIKLAVMDAFTPGVKKVVIVPSAPAKVGLSNIPSSMAGGDGNWYFTGLVEQDGRRQALLENTTTGEAMYVRSGEAWKAAHISTIDIEAVVMVGPDGTVARIPLQKYGEVPGVAPSRVATNAGSNSNQPLNIPTGAIGAGVPGGLGVRPVGGNATLRLPNGQTVDVPMDSATAVAGTDSNTNNNQGGRRGRRNRQRQNTGDINNGF